MITPITATFPALNFPKEVDYPTQEDWAEFSAAAELNYGILSGEWSDKSEEFKTQANNLAQEIQDIGENAINAITFDNIAQLKLNSNMGRVDVLGYYAKGDGGGGIFYWDSTSTEADNGGTIIQATGVTTGRWKRVINGAVNVKAYGAKGDETTDDLIAINTCIANHLIIDFEPLVYYVSDRVIFRKEQVVFGNGAILKINGNYTGVQLFGDTSIDNLIVSQSSGIIEGTGYVVNAGIDEITGLDNGNIQAFQTKNIEVIGCEIAFKQIATHPSQVRGIAYSKTHARRFFNCKYSYYFETQGKGWINANEYENKQILADTTIPGSAGIKIEHHGLELSSHSFKGMLFEKVAELIEHSSTGATFQFVGFEIEGYFEAVGFNNLNTYNEIFIKNTRNRHSIQDVYAGIRYSTTIVKGNSDKQGGNFRIERVSTTDAGNVIGWEFKDDRYPDRFKIADKNRFYYNGSLQDKWVGNLAKTGGTVIITIADYQAETIVCKVRIMARCTYNTTRKFYEGLLTVDQTNGVVFLDSMNSLNSLTVVASVSGSNLLITTTAPTTNDYYLYSMNIEGSINKNITVA